MLSNYPVVSDKTPFMQPQSQFVTIINLLGWWFARLLLVAGLVGSALTGNFAATAILLIPAMGSFLEGPGALFS